MAAVMMGIWKVLRHLKRNLPAACHYLNSGSHTRLKRRDCREKSLALEQTRGQDYTSGKRLTFHMFDTSLNYTHSDI